jgi:NAD+ diphosphatase
MGNRDLNTAFFFQGNSCLLPLDSSDSGFDAEIPLTHLCAFDISPDVYSTDLPDQFEIPALSALALVAHTEAVIRVVCIPPNISLPSGWRAIPVRHTLPLSGECYAGKKPAGRAEPASSSRLLRAFHIAQWRQESRFCAAWGAKNTDSPAELARLCPVCGRLEYPRIAPAIIVIVTNDKGQVLLAHNKKFTPGVYSLIAGFNEAGENLETTVRRELREEASIEVTDIRYIISQPWPFPHSLMVGFSARYASGDVKADDVEIEDARWWNKDALPNLPGPCSLSRLLIEKWLAGEIGER